MIDDPKARQEVARFLAGVIDQLVRKHSRRRTQEPQLTSRIAERLDTLDIDPPRGTNIMRIKIIAQDFTDRGPHADEHESGIDVYISIEVIQGGNRVSKGIVVQSKRPGRADGLVKQCGKMLERTDGAYVWIYEPSGTIVVNAQHVLDNPRARPETLDTRPVAELFDTILECTEGDPEIGIPDAEDEEEALEDMIERLSAGVGISASVLLDERSDR